jgi:hypothetical protein
MTNEKLTLVSPAVVSAVVAACNAEDGANAKWVSAASKLYTVGVRFAQLDDTKGTEYVSIRSMVVQAQKPNIVTLLQSSSTIGFTDQERADRRYYVNRVDNVHMKRVREHLKRFEESADRGTPTKKSMGKSMADKCQEMIDRIKKADEEKIDFDAVDATALLKELKACFLK